MNFQKKGIVPADWDKLMKALKQALSPEIFAIVEKILWRFVTFYI